MLYASLSATRMVSRLGYAPFCSMPFATFGTDKKRNGWVRVYPLPGHHSGLDGRRGPATVRVQFEKREPFALFHELTIRRVYRTQIPEPKHKEFKAYKCLPSGKKFFEYLASNTLQNTLYCTAPNAFDCCDNLP